MTIADTLHVSAASVSLTEAGRLLGLTKRSIYYRISDGYLETVRVGSSQRVTRDSLNAELNRAYVLGRKWRKRKKR